MSIIFGKQINMHNVLTAFATNYGGQVKKRTHHYQSHGDEVTWIWNEYVGERFVLSANGVWEYPNKNHVAFTQIGDSHRPGMIHDVWDIVGENVGINGTYQDTDGIYLTFDPMMEMTPNTIGSEHISLVSPTTTFNVLSWKTKSLTTIGKVVSKSAHFEMFDTKGEIGKRWVLVLTWRGDMPDMPVEELILDLGSTEGVVNPEYSAIGYRHKFAFNDSSFLVEERYGDIVPLDYHVDNLPQFLWF